MGVNWNALLAQDRCRAIGVAWTEEEQVAIKDLKIPADYVRNGILTKEAYEAQLAKHKASGSKPTTYLSKKEVQAEAKALGIEFTDETTRPELLELLQLHKEKINQPASA